MQSDYNDDDQTAQTTQATQTAPLAAPQRQFGMNDRRDDKRFTMAISLISLGVTLFGLYRILGPLSDYYELGQLVILAIFLFFSLLLYFNLRDFRFYRAFFIVALMFALLSVSAQKYNWRKEYINNGFTLEAYIDSYPSWETYLAGDMLELPNWVSFAQNCEKPIMRNRPVPRQCQTLDAIKETFNIDMRSALLDDFRKMKTTADKIANGRMNQEAYINCVNAKQCAQVPLMPKDVNLDTFDQRSMEYIEIRRAFWQLVKGDKITPEICQFMYLCTVLNKLGAYDPEKF